MFALVCLMTILAAPAAFSDLMTGFSIPAAWEAGFRVAALISLLVYFYAAMVLRLRAYEIARAAAVRRAGSILLAMIMLAAVGFYGA